LFFLLKTKQKSTKLISKKKKLLKLQKNINLLIDIIALGCANFIIIATIIKKLFKLERSMRCEIINKPGYSPFSFDVFKL